MQTFQTPSDLDGMIMFSDIEKYEIELLYNT